MTKRFLPLLLLSALTGCQAPQGLPTAGLPATPGYRIQDLHGPDEPHPHPQKHRKHKKHKKHKHHLAPDAPEAFIERVELKSEVPLDNWDAATVEFESLDTPGLTDSLELTKGVSLTANDHGYVAKGTLLTGLPPGHYACTVSLWQDGAYGTLVGEERHPVNLKDNANSLRFSPVRSETLGFVGYDSVLAVPGATVSLNGLGFSLCPSLNEVTLGGIPATVLGATPNRLTVAVPDLATGSYVCWIQVGSGMVGKTGFTVAAP